VSNPATDSPLFAQRQEGIFLSLKRVVGKNGRNIPAIVGKIVGNVVANFNPGKPLATGEIQSLTVDAGERDEFALDRQQRTREIYGPNDYYGHATILKNYAQIPQRKTIKAAIEHGLDFGGFVWDEDMNCRLPAILVSAKFRFPVLEKHTDKKLFAIGPLLGYAPHLLSEKALESEKQRLGRNLLVFPAHSTHIVDSYFDIDEYCKHLGEIGKDFDTIRICLYWKDVLRGRVKDFTRYGFECVTAGHIFDPLFLPRLKSIIECATVTTSNDLGTHVGYCVFMGKPHYLFSHKITLTAETEEILKSSAPDRSDKPDVVELVKAFSEWRDDISVQQKEVVERYWGISERKSVNELSGILEEVDELYKKQRKILFRLKDRCNWLVR
jgi:hypothetical protein